MNTIAINNRRATLDEHVAVLKALVALLDDMSDALDVTVHDHDSARLLTCIARAEADDAADEVKHALGERGIASATYSDAPTTIARATVRAVRRYADLVDVHALNLHRAEAAALVGAA